MKKLIMFFISFLCCCSYVFSAPAPFNEIVFFGDSLSDDGNIYRLFLKIVPKSPPYFKGRFSNGPTWSEYVGKYFYDKYYINFTNYAYGGATAILHLPNIRFIAPTNLEIEINNYFFDSLFKSKSKVFYSIWIGGNDYLYDLDSDMDSLSSRVVDKISWAITSLYEHGGRYFLVLNLPDLGSTPYARAHRTVERMHQFSELHNQKLAQAVLSFQKKHPDAKIIFMNAYDIFNGVINDPGSYNKKYHINIKYTSEACWQGGLLLREMLSKESIMKDLEDAKWSQSKIDPIQGMDFGLSTIIDWILKSPPIAQAYSLGKLFEKGYRPCENADEYLFWDQMHPTEVVHQVLSQVVLERLKNEM